MTAKQENPTMKTKMLLAIVTAAAMVAPAMAQETEPQKYDRDLMGGYIHTETDGKSLNGVRVEMRKHYNDYFALGLGLDSSYTDFSGVGVAGDLNVSTVDFGAIIKLPIDTWYLYAKGGLTYVYADISGTANGYHVDESASDTKYFYGFGMNVPFGDRWFADASIAYKHPKFDFGYGVEPKVQMDTVSIQIGYRF